MGKSAFLQRRMHSALGLFLVFFLVEHLLVNSQAALWIGEDGAGFVRMVNSIHSLPYLPVIEVFLLGVPFLFHAIWGIAYIFTSASNSQMRSVKNRPELSQFSRNHAYTWQRLTSWILLVGIALHVGHMRFLREPQAVSVPGVEAYLVPVDFDSGLYTLASRLNVEIFDHARIIRERLQLERSLIEFGHKYGQDVLEANPLEFNSEAFQSTDAVMWKQWQAVQSQRKWVNKLEKYSISPHEVILVADSFGKAALCMVRDSFKSLWVVCLYTILVTAACFHAFNGLWTFLITWGVTASGASQQRALRLSQGLMVVVLFWGLAAAWGTYWVNLRY